MDIRFSLIVVAALLTPSTIDALAAPALPTDSFRTVALTTNPLPGLPSDVAVQQFSYPRIDNSGRVAFKAILFHKPGVVDFSNDTGIWSEVAPGNIQLVARSGQIVSGIDYRFHDVEPGENLRMSGGGDLYFLSGISPLAAPTAFNDGIFRYSQGAGLELVVTSSPSGVPGVPSVGASSLANFMDYNEAGDITR